MQVGVKSGQVSVVVDVEDFNFGDSETVQRFQLGVRDVDGFGVGDTGGTEVDRGQSW